MLRDLVLTQHSYDLIKQYSFELSVNLLKQDGVTNLALFKTLRGSTWNANIPCNCHRIKHYVWGVNFSKQDWVTYFALFKTLRDSAWNASISCNCHIIKQSTRLKYQCMPFRMSSKNKESMKTKRGEPKKSLYSVIKALNN